MHPILRSEHSGSVLKIKRGMVGFSLWRKLLDAMRSSERRERMDFMNGLMHRAAPPCGDISIEMGVVCEKKIGMASPPSADINIECGAVHEKTITMAAASSKDRRHNRMAPPPTVQPTRLESHSNFSKEHGPAHRCEVQQTRVGGRSNKLVPLSHLSDQLRRGHPAS